ncbi:hypothetical protein [Embleya sp. NPDC020630]|uniref:hypothetical protein n=1 Tax=Embleya sp. NPDC020630 TaxID=3363979 RepID=UPI0037932C08
MTGQPLDLDAIRADQAKLLACHAERRSLLPVERRLTDVHAPALLDLTERLEAKLADAERRVALAQRLARRDDHDLDIDLEGLVGDGLCGAADWDGDDRPPQWLVDRVVEIVRPHLARALEHAAGLVETVDALRRGSDRLDAEAERLFVERNEARAEIERLRAAGEPEAYPARDRFRVEVHEALDVDVPDGGWSPVTSLRPSLAEAVERMQARRMRYPEMPPMRVVRERETRTVAAMEGDDASRAPEGPQDTRGLSHGPALAPDRS